MRRWSWFFFNISIAAVCHEVVDIEGIVFAEDLLWGLLQLADDFFEICSQTNDGKYHGLQIMVSMAWHSCHGI